MGKTTKRISRIRKKKVKEGLLKGKSYAKAMIDAGYSESTARHNVSPYNTLLKTVDEEIEREFKEEDVTVQQVLKEIEVGKVLALRTGNLVAYKEFVTLKAKYLGILKDKQIIVDEYDESEFYKSLFPNRLDN